MSTIPTFAEDFSGNWCNEDAVASSLLESISLVTPLLEKFFVRTVAEAIAMPHGAELRERCLAFIREESQHSRMHQKLNTRLHAYLGDRLAGVRFIEFLLDAANSRFSLARRLLLTAALEHISAVFSKTYVRLSGPLKIEFESARSLFFQHAHEELAHCSVVFDLLHSSGGSGRLQRFIILLACAIFGLIYLCIAVPWIVHRKTNHKYHETFFLLARSLLSRHLYAQVFLVIPEFFSFVRKDYHPARFVDS